jgi:hypothetical protein
MLEGKLPLGRLFADGSHPPETPLAITPGTDLSHAPPPRAGAITQAPDGRVYAAATGHALWNLEITGLAAVRALPGGELTIKSTTP